MASHDRHAACVLGVLAIGIAIWYAYDQTSGNDTTGVPAVEGEGQVMGLGVNAGLSFSGGPNCLDLNPNTHFWAPGYNPRDKDSPQPTITSKVRYPIVPGGNMTTVMHRGWSAFTEAAPADNDDRINPPEVAVL